MSREVKRVPLGFNWPIRETWDGYINPHYRECPENCGAGYSITYRSLAKHINSLIWDREALGDPAYAKVAVMLTGREPSAPFGYDSMAAYSAILKLGTLAGLSKDWHQCPICKGSGIDPAVSEKYESWEPTDPPAGDGWQMWETTSEGSPISPVFDTPEKLARWLADNNASAFGSSGASYDDWLAMIKKGYAPSAVSGPGYNGLVSGVEFIARNKEA